MFGATADIRSGDFAVLSPYLPPITSIDRKLTHTWCSVNGVAPVDLALTMAYFGQAPQLRAALLRLAASGGVAFGGDWQVSGRVNG